MDGFLYSIIQMNANRLQDEAEEIQEYVENNRSLTEDESEDMTDIADSIDTSAHLAKGIANLFLG